MTCGRGFAELLRRERSQHPLPRTVDVVGPETLTGTDIAAIWTSILRREVCTMETISTPSKPRRRR